ncbi:hypothetical protein ACOMHN_024371 [Nucella lapillus]
MCGHSPCERQRKRNNNKQGCVDTRRVKDRGRGTTTNRDVWTLAVLTTEEEEQQQTGMCGDSPCKRQRKRNNNKQGCVDTRRVKDRGRGRGTTTNRDVWTLAVSTTKEKEQQQTGMCGHSPCERQRKRKRNNKQ